MISTNIFAGLLTMAAIATAAPVSTGLSALDALNTTTWTPEHILQEHEVILVGKDSRMEVMSKALWKELVASRSIFGINSETLPPLNSSHSFDPKTLPEQGLINTTSIVDGKEVTKRCYSRTNVIVDSRQTFAGWDVQMSPVVYATTSAATITVTSGYTVTNSITVGASISGAVEFITAALKIDFSQSWATSYQAALASPVQPGWSGVWVINPVTHRTYGRVLDGCIGAQTKSSFMADNFDQGSYDGLNWVAGVISLCTKRGRGLTRCEGSGGFR